MTTKNQTIIAEKTCTKCYESQNISDFHKQKDNKSGLRNICKKCCKAYGAPYNKSKKGKMVRTYVNMDHRVRGMIKPHLYKGLEIMSKEDFYQFTEQSEAFDKLYDEWVKSGYERRLSPSIDRIDSKVGYIEGNIQWITHGENSRKGTLSRFSKVAEHKRLKECK